MIFNNVYKGKKVLVTGHTGFKGSWLCKWLEMMGADLVGFSLEPSTIPNHFNIIDIKMNSVIGDIKNYNKLNRIFKEHKPELIFHLAAQPSVLESYDKKSDFYTETALFKSADSFLNYKNKSLCLKIDVEGHELFAINGLKKILSNNKIFLQIEIFNKNYKKVYKKLKTFGLKKINRIKDDYYFIKS